MVGNCALTELFALVADDNDGLAGEGRCPILYVAVGAARCAGNQSRIRSEIFVDADVNQRRRVRRANESRQFVG
jgi:hypothetical protein